MYQQLFGLLGLFHTLVHAVPIISDTFDSNSGNHQGYTFGKAGVNKTFDYVVIGGGTAGLTVATRLAEKAGISVAVIEAGGFYEQDSGNTSTIPADNGDSTTPGVDINPLIDWNFTTTPQTVSFLTNSSQSSEFKTHPKPRCITCQYHRLVTAISNLTLTILKGIDNRVLHYARGKTLGGSSAENNLYYQRPTTGSMQKWADQVGDQSFTFANLLPYYKKSVDFTPPQIDYKNSTNQQDPSAFSPSGGPLQVSFGHYDDPWSSWSQKGYQAIGQPLIKGFSSGKLIGNSFIGQTADPTTEVRSTSESSFLESTKTMKTKLTVYKNTLAEKIIFKGRENCAEGVIVAPEGVNGPDGGTYALFAKKGTLFFPFPFPSQKSAASPRF